jgi:hypothetical protein
MDRRARVADCLDHELRFDPLRPLGEHQDRGEIQHAIIGCQVHVLQQASQFRSRVWILLLVRIPQEVTEAQSVEPIDARLGGQSICVELVGHLEQPAQLFLGLDAATIAPSLEPDDAIPVEVRLVQPLGNRENNDHAAIAQGHVLCRWGDRTAHVLRGRVTDELVEAAHIRWGQPQQCAVVRNADEQHPAAAIRERDQVRSE